MTREEFLAWATRFPEALMLVTGDGRILACNGVLLTLLNTSEEDVARTTFFEFAQSSPETVRAALRLWSTSGQMVYGPAAFRSDAIGKIRCEGAAVVPRKGDTPATLIVRVKRHEAAAERFVALNATIDRLSKEVHARKRSEELIRVQREWLHTTLSSIGDAVIATDIEGKVEFLNAAAERLTGWALQEAEGLPCDKIFAIFDEMTGAARTSPVSRVLRDGVIVALANHTVLRARDGTEHPIEDTAAPIRDSAGVLDGVVLVFHDVSEKRRAQVELAESERRFRLLTDLNVIAAGVADLAGSFLDANDALLEMLGHTREELVAGHVNWRDLTPPEFIPADERAIAEAKQRGACQPYEKEYFRKDGRRVPIIIGYALFKAPKRYAHQQTDELAICYIVDISERKRAEELLEKRVEERTAKLQEALADLETFSYTISHDLRAPLRSMQAYAEFLLEDYGPKLDDKARAFLTKIVRSGEHLDALIQDVLTYARVSKQNQELTSIDLGRLLSEVIERYPNFSAPGVRIELAPSFPVVRGNEPLLTQCFSNLIGNAIKFVPPDRSPRVKVWSETPEKRVRVFVQDNGIGIEKADMERIFGIFERVHHSHKYEGTGIGLSVVRRAVEKMGGKVGVESQPGLGSCFWIELEAAQP